VRVLKRPAAAKKMRTQKPAATALIDRVRTQLTHDAQWLDVLVSPFARILKDFGGLSSSMDFKFITRDYTVLDIQADNINEYFSKLDFYTFWVHISRVFDERALKVFDNILIPLFDDMVKSLHLATLSITHSAQPTTDETLYNYMSKHEDEFFPLNLSFRESSFVAQHLSKREKSAQVFANLTATCVLDEFLLTPHVQLILLYAMGALINYIEQKINSQAPGHTTFLLDLKNMLANENTNIPGDQHILLVFLAENLILDRLFFISHMSTISAHSNSTSSEVIQQLKSYGTIHSIGNVDEFKRSFDEMVSAINVFNNSANINLIQSDTSYMCALSQLRNVAALVTGSVTPREFMMNSGPPIYEINKAIAYVVYLRNKDSMKAPDKDEDVPSDQLLEPETVATACGDVPNSLNEMLLVAARKRFPQAALYELSVDPYKVELEDSSMAVLPLSYMPLFGQPAYRP
jgi:hypothetical protein